MDIRHIFEQSTRAIILKPGRDEVFLDIDLFNRTVDGLAALAVDTAKSEGLNPEGLIFILELDMKYTNQLHGKRIRSPRVRLKNEGQVRELIAAFGEVETRAYGPAGMFPEGGVGIENFILHAVSPLKNIEFKTYPAFPSSPPAEARCGHRKVYWEDQDRALATPIFSLDRLRCGNIVEGPAVIEADNTTLVLPEFGRLNIDRYRNFFIELFP
jgi:N-methylhydantoinase A/acetophenone carboxylase